MKQADDKNGTSGQRNKGTASSYHRPHYHACERKTPGARGSHSTSGRICNGHCLTNAINTDRRHSDPVIASGVLINQAINEIEERKTMLDNQISITAGMRLERQISHFNITAAVKSTSLELLTQAAEKLEHERQGLSDQISPRIEKVPTHQTDAEEERVRRDREDTEIPVETTNGFHGQEDLGVTPNDPTLRSVNQKSAGQKLRFSADLFKSPIVEAQRSASEGAKAPGAIPLGEPDENMVLSRSSDWWLSVGTSKEYDSLQRIGEMENIYEPQPWPSHPKDDEDIYQIYPRPGYQYPRQNKGYLPHFYLREEDLLVSADDQHKELIRQEIPSSPPETSGVAKFLALAACMICVLCATGIHIFN